MRFRRLCLAMAMERGSDAAMLAIVAGFALAAASISAVAGDTSPPAASAGTSQAQPSKGAQKAKHEGMKQEVSDWEKELKEKMRAINREANQKLAEARKEMRAKSAQIRQEAREKAATLKKEMGEKQGATQKREKAEDK